MSSLTADGGSRTVTERPEGARPQLDPNRWDNLFRTLYTDPWQQARSRAQSVFPGNRISDSLADLDLTVLRMIRPIMPFMPFMPAPFMPVPNTGMHAVSGVVLVAKLIAPCSLPFISGWVVEVSRAVFW